MYSTIPNPDGFLQVVDGTATNPSISFLSDPDTGFYKEAADRLALSIGGITRFYFDAAGIQAPNGDATAPAYKWNGETNSGFYRVSAGIIGFSILAAEQIRFVAGSVLFGTTTNSSNGRIQLATHTASTGGIGFGTDVALWRRTAGAVAFTDMSGGAAPEIRLYDNATARSALFASGSQTGLTAITGALVLASNNATALTLDTSQNAVFAGYVSIPNNQDFRWAGRCVITSPADGVIRLTNTAQSDFTRLQFGGTTSTFPAIKRVSGNLEIKLADDSAYTGLLALNLFSTGGRVYMNSGGTVFWGLGAGSPEGVINASVGSLWTRTDGGAATTLYVKQSGAGNTGWAAVTP